jgi:Zn-dependent protease
VLAITPEKIILVAFFLLIGFPVHEFAHAFVAYRLGDGTAKLFGRLTLNPIAHFDPIGGLMLVVSVLLGSGFVIGWAKPTPVNTANLRDRRNGEVFVSLAGPLSNLLMALAGALVFRVVFTPGTTLPDQVFQLLFDFVLFNVMLAIFNFIPVPPLDGSTLLFRFVSPQTAWRLRPMLAQYGFFVILFIVLLGGSAIGNVILRATLVLLGLNG